MIRLAELPDNKDLCEEASKGVVIPPAKWATLRAQSLVPAVEKKCAADRCYADKKANDFSDVSEVHNCEREHQLTSNIRLAVRILLIYEPGVVG